MNEITSYYMMMNEQSWPIIIQFCPKFAEFCSEMKVKVKFKAIYNTDQFPEYFEILWKKMSSKLFFGICLLTTVFSNISKTV